MKARTLEELQVWQLAKSLASAIAEILERPKVKRDRKLYEQLTDSSMSMLSNVGEGYGQTTDRAFAHYLAIARGSNNEAKGQLALALAKRYISLSEHEELHAASNVLGKKLTVFIRYLRKEDRDDRG